MTDGFVSGYRGGTLNFQGRRDFQPICVTHMAKVSMVIDFEKLLVLPKVDDF